MTALGHTVPEPIRDEEDWDSLEPIPCPECKGLKLITIKRADHRDVTRACRNPECHEGTVLRGDRPGSRYCLTLHYLGGANV